MLQIKTSVATIIYLLATCLELEDFTVTLVVVVYIKLGTYSELIYGRRRGIKC